METLCLNERDVLLFNGPKIIVLRKCIEQSYQYCLYCKIIDILSEDDGSNDDIVRK